MTIKTADKLSVGDVVLHYGMRLVIDQPITVRDDKIGAVYSTRARIANWDELVAEAGDGRGQPRRQQCCCFRGQSGTRRNAPWAGCRTAMDGAGQPSGNVPNRGLAVDDRVPEQFGIR